MHAYDEDILAWADEQAFLLRSGRFDQLDIAHLAEEIEDVGKSEQRELAHRMAILLAHLLKWQFQASRRGASWERAIKEQRRSIMRRLERTPSLRPMLTDADWLSEIWSDAVAAASAETGLADFSESCPWPTDQVLHSDWLPA